jgi:hypothetical protein
LDAYD